MNCWISDLEISNSYVPLLNHKISNYVVDYPVIAIEIIFAKQESFADLQ